MKYLITILTAFFITHSFAQTPTSNAGSDQTIYLTTTNQVTLVGTATNSSSVHWTEVSTDYLSGATITSANSLTTTVTGLPQGVFYFELTVTSPTDIVAVDTVKVIVNLSAVSGTLLRSIAQSAFTNDAFVAKINDRTGDTTNTLDEEVYPITFPDGLGNEVFFDRDRKPDMYIDAQAGKFQSRIEDGYQWNGQGYNRAEMSFGNGYHFDTTKTYEMVWKGYFPQGFSTLTLNQSVAIFMQVHANNTSQNNYGTQMINTGSGTQFIIDSIGKHFVVCGLDSFVNKTHTVAVTFKESAIGGFYKVEVDGVQKVYIPGGWGGLPRGQDYPKLATLYDYANALVDPTNSTRHRTFSLITEDFSIYDVTNAVAAPTVSVSNKSVTSGSTTLTATATFAGGHTGTYLWTQVSGSGAATTLSGTTSSTLNISGLVTGTYQFKCTVTQDDSQTANATGTVTVTIPAPTIYAGNNQTISVPTATLAATYTLASGFTETFNWVLESGAACTINSPHASTTTVSNLKTGTYRFGCTLTQSDGQTAYDYVIITVSIPAPTVNVGADKTITTTTTSLTASGTTVSGYTLSYIWSEISGGSAIIDNNTNQTINISGLSAGTYQFAVKATQNDGQFALDTVQVTVSLSIAAPTISMSGDQIIHVTSTTVLANAFWASGHSGTYLWTRISGSGSSISTPNSSSTNVIDLSNGVYQYQCTATQDDGQTVSGVVTVTVALPPTANAGSNFAITLPTSSATLSGSATGVGTLTYSWTFISGLVTPTITNGTTLAPTVSGMTTAGNYVFQLTVTDGYSQTATSQVTITVNSATVAKKYLHGKGIVLIQR